MEYPRAQKDNIARPEAEKHSIRSRVIKASSDSRLPDPYSTSMAILRHMSAGTPAFSIPGIICVKNFTCGVFESPISPACALLAR
jgi:hypothetical protein